MQIYEKTQTLLCKYLKRQKKCKKQDNWRKISIFAVAIVESFSCQNDRTQSFN